MNIRTNLIRRALAVVLSVSVGAVPGLADAEQPMAFRSSDDCAADEPDSVQISWDSFCLTGAWLMDTEHGCRMWDWHPAPGDGATWTGACLDGVKSGHGVLQWYEHGRPIDRFEGTFVAGRRKGYGRYVWNESDWFAGLYSDDLPDGSGTASIAGEVVSGKWRLGCLANDGKVVAISVPLGSCAHEGQLAAGRHRLRPVARETSRRRFVHGSHIDVSNAKPDAQGLAPADLQQRSRSSGASSRLRLTDLKTETMAPRPSP